MGAKFIVDRRCSVKSSLTLSGLIEGLKYRGVLRRVSDLAAAGALPACDEDSRLEQVLPSEAGVPAGMTLGALQAHIETLMNHRVACRQCPSSMNGHVGGCIAYVPYPLSEGLEFLLWRTAVMSLNGELPEALAPEAMVFVERARELRQTPFADGMRARGDILGRRPRIWQNGPVWKRDRLTSAQVLDGFFLNGVLAGDGLRVHAGFLRAALAVARAMAPALPDDERRQALAEDTQPYSEVLDLMDMALEQGMGIYVWP